MLAKCADLGNARGGASVWAVGRHNAKPQLILTEDRPKLHIRKRGRRTHTGLLEGRRPTCRRASRRESLPSAPSGRDCCGAYGNSRSRGSRRVGRAPRHQGARPHLKRRGRAITLARCGLARRDKREGAGRMGRGAPRGGAGRGQDVWQTRQNHRRLRAVRK